MSATRIRIRRGTASEWAAANPVLALAEPGFETDTGRTKYGDGSTAWDDLLYDSQSAESVEAAASRAGGPGEVLHIEGPRGGVFDWAASGTVDDVITFAADNGVWVRRWDGLRVDIAWAGGVADGVTDNSNAAFRAVNAAPSSDAIHVHFPAGTFRVDSPIYLSRKVRLSGAGRDETTLDFSNMTSPVNAPYSCAIVAVHPANIDGTGAANPVLRPSGQVGTYGLYSDVSGMWIKGDPGASGTVNGIVANCPITLGPDLHVSGFTGDGICVLGSGTYDGLAVGGNANLGHFRHVRSAGNGRNGLRFLGSDANAFLVAVSDFRNNGEWGVRDDSLHGGTVQGCHTAGNGSGGYASVVTGSNVNRTAWVGNYTEGGQPAAYAVGNRNIIVGATGALPVAQPYIGSTNSGHIAQRDLNVASSDDAASDIGGATEKASRIGRGRLQLRTEEGSGLIAVERVSAVYGGVTYDGIQAMLFHFAGRTDAIKKGRPYFPEGVTMGTASAIIQASAAPTSGANVIGTIAVNSAPTATKMISHWKCIASGTPGTWRAVGTGRGTTAQRTGLSLASGDAGYTFWDTDLGQMCHWNGSSWDV